MAAARHAAFASSSPWSLPPFPWHLRRSTPFPGFCAKTLWALERLSPSSCPLAGGKGFPWHGPDVSTLLIHGELGSRGSCSRAGTLGALLPKNRQPWPGQTAWGGGGGAERPEVALVTWESPLLPGKLAFRGESIRAPEGGAGTVSPPHSRASFTLCYSPVAKALRGLPPLWGREQLVPTCKGL